MANEEHLEILKQGVEVWNKWRKDNPTIAPNLLGPNLRRANFTGEDLRGADLRGVDLRGADLVAADLSGADLNYSNLNVTKLNGADLRAADLRGADLGGANLADAVLGRAILLGAFFSNTELSNANFENARIGNTSFSNVDLSVAKNLDQILHKSPSSIGIDTLYRSGGKIPAEFLRGCGIPEDLITFLPSIIGAQQAIQFYSCFISYSTKDDEFARRLYSRMRDEKLRVWFAPEEMKGGEKVDEQIERAIQLHDRLLVVLSEESMKSNWVINEIRNARRVELKENRRKLFPIGLTPFDKIKDWKRIDPDTGEDLALELRSYYIPDFSHWKDHDSFEKEFGKLLRDLRDEEKRRAGNS